MTIVVLFIVVFAQVLVFQLLAIRLARALPGLLVAGQGLPEGVDAGIDRLRRDGGRARAALGAALCVVAVVTTFALGLDDAARKIALFVISIVSSTALVAGYVHDRRAVAALTARLPEPALRSASLARPSLVRQYALVWEAVPIALVAVTVAVTIWAAARVDTRAGEAIAGLSVIPLLQAIYVGGCLFFSVRYAASAGGVPQRSRAFMDTPEEAIALAATLMRAELRFFLAAKIAIALMLSLMQAERIVTVLGGDPPVWLAGADWALLLVALALFAAYLVKIARVRTRGMRPIG